MGLHKGGGIQDKTSTLEDLEARIQEVVNDIPDDVRQKVAHSIPNCLGKLVETTAAYIEV